MVGEILVRIRKNRRGVAAKKVFTLAKDTKMVQFEYGDLWGHVANLQKRALVGRWLFTEMKEVDMVDWIRVT